MRKRLSLGFVALACAIVSGAAQAITFGEPDGTRHPNVGALVTDSDPNSPEPEQFCTGTLVSPTLFLTEAHCLYGWIPAGQPVWVTFQPAYDESAAVPSGLHRVLGWTLHEGFAVGGGGADAHDIAIVRLESAPSVTPAQLPTLGLLNTYSQQQLRQLTFTTVATAWSATRRRASRTPSSTRPRGWSRSRQCSRCSRPG
jgi:secreted trypsin-like serine protease